MEFVYSLIAVSIVSLLSLLGALLLLVNKSFVNRTITILLALSSGVMLGNVFFDLIPESLELMPEGALMYILVGFVSFFALEKLLSWHHHTEGDTHSHHADKKPFVYLTLVGDSIHNFVDGAVIAAAFLTSVPLGITTSIAVVAHELPHELSDFIVLLNGGLKNKQALLFNFLSALTAVLGTIAVFILSDAVVDLERYLIPFAAGNFLYIAATDLIPELHTKRALNQNILQILAMIAGILLILQFSH